MPKRILNSTIWEDEHFGSLSDKAKILFISCISNADDDGRLSANPSNLRANAFRFNDISISDILKLRDEVSNTMRNFNVYTKDDCEYIQFNKWRDHQYIREDRYKPSKIPSCQPDDNQVTTDVRLKLNKTKLNKYKECRFLELWNQYPNKDGKKIAFKHFCTSVETEEDWKDINTALKNYLSSKRVQSGYVKNGSTWFNNWRDFVDWVEPISDKDKERDKDDQIAKRIFRD